MSNRNPHGKTRANQRKKEFIRKKVQKQNVAKKQTDKILKFGHPLLKTICEPVSPSDDLSFINEMKVVLGASKNGIGLSANQIGITKRVIITDIRKNNKFIVMINPEYKIIKETDVETGQEIVKTFEHDEGCLSYPGMFIKNSRPRRILVKYYDEKRQQVTEEYKDLESTLFLHEIDHLDGKCFLGEIWEKRKEKREKILGYKML